MSTHKTEQMFKGPVIAEFEMKGNVFQKYLNYTKEQFLFFENLNDQI